METKAILRSVLYQVQRAKDLGEAVRSVRVMCSQDDIDAVERELNEEKEAGS